MKLRIGELLISKNLISEEQLQKALEAQRIYGGKVGTNLVEMGFVTDSALAKALGEQLKMAPATMADFENISQDALALIAVDYAKENKLIPLGLDKRLRVAISDPFNLAVIDQLGFKTGKAIEPLMSPEIWVVAALERYYNVPRDTRYVAVSEADVGIGGAGQVTYDVSTELDQNYAGKFGSVAIDIPIPMFLKRLSETSTKEQVFDALLDFIGPIFPRMAVYVTRKDQFSGWIVRGFPIHTKEFLAVSVPFNVESALKTVMTSGTEFVGEIEKAKGAELGFAILQIPFHQQIRLYPIYFRGKVITILLGVPDEQRKPVSSEGTQLVQVACRKVGMALEKIALQKQILSPPQSA